MYVCIKVCMYVCVYVCILEGPMFQEKLAMPVWPPKSWPFTNGSLFWSLARVLGQSLKNSLRVKHRGAFLFPQSGCTLAVLYLCYGPRRFIGSPKYSMNMWCPEDLGRDSWDRGGQEAVVRPDLNAPQGFGEEALTERTPCQG